MPDFKRKNIKKVSLKKPAAKAVSKNKMLRDDDSFDDIGEIEEIKMTEHRPSKRPRPTPKPPEKKAVKRKNGKLTASEPVGNLRLIEGTKKRRARRRLISAVLGLALVLGVVLFSILTPTGIPEAFTNYFSAMGGGNGFPVHPDGDKLISLQSNGGNSFALTDTHLTVYNGGGRDFLAIQHGFSNPVLDVSEARSLIYNRGANGIIIANNKQILLQKELQGPLICADIGRDGTTVFATKVTGYAGQIEVFNKDFRSVFKWLSAKEMISDVAVSRDGKRVAVSTITVKNGAFNSSIYCFRTSSASQLFKVDLNDTAVLSLTDISNDVFAASTESAVTYIHWNDGTSQKASSSEDNKLLFFKSSLSGESVSVFQTTANTDSYEIKTYSSKGKEVSDFQYKGTINDISIHDNLIYILESNSIECLNKSGSVESTVQTEYLANYISVLSKNKVVAGNDSSVSIYSLKK